MRDQAAVESLASLQAPWGEIDLLLNKCGLAPPTDPLPDTEWQRIDEVIETNVTGLVALTQGALLRKLIERKGQIINLSSVAATYPYKGGAVYAGTKAFVRQFSLDLRSDLEGSGVRVTSVEPGMAETEFTLVRNGWRRSRRQTSSIPGFQPDHCERRCRTVLVACEPAPASQRQCDRVDARQPELCGIQDRPGLIADRADRRRLSPFKNFAHFGQDCRKT